MQNTPEILIVDELSADRQSLQKAFEAAGFKVTSCRNHARGVAAIRSATPSAMILGATLPDGCGMDLLSLPELAANTPPFIVIADQVGVQDVVDAMKAGALDVVERPLFAGHILSLMTKALTDRGISKPAPKAAEPASALSRPPIIGKSDALMKVIESMELVTRSNSATVLVQGESGTGKELIARAIHFDGPRSKERFLAINCATLTESLLEAELFGYEKGAFTGALETGKKGLFEAANGGTLFLDEIGDLASSLQAKLLRALQEGSFKRVGGIEDVHVDVRVIAATNRDLLEDTQTGRFRADLYYRLNVVPIEVPPLRARRSDITELALYFINRFADDLGKSIRTISVAAKDRLQNHPWPGNIRELRNVCEYAAIVCDQDVIETRHLTLPTPQADEAMKDSIPLGDRTLKGMESELIHTILNETHFNISRAASILGINRSTLYNKMKDYGLEREKCPRQRQTV